MNSHNHKKLFRHLLFLCVSIFFLVGSIPIVKSASVTELKDSISKKSSEIQAIEAEIARFEHELEQVGAERETLENAITELNISRNKLLSETRLTENKIESTSYSIEKIEIEIKSTETYIAQNNEALGESLRRIHANDEQTLVEAVLAHETLSDFWDEVASLNQFQNSVQTAMKELVVLKSELNSRQGTLLDEEHTLRQLSTQLTGQRQVIEANKQQKNVLLEKTQSTESEYQKLLAEKRRQREQFESELLKFERELEFAIDPGRLPDAGSVLAWPLKSVLITQFFGNTSFAQTNAYNGNGHNGIDFRASVGTPVLSALTGTVQGTGNTDLQNGCYSYGKWVLIRHNNGLATLYAHLSSITVSAGEQVRTGDIIGLSGNTGYSTGPHLHFTVFASEGVGVHQFSKSINCKNVSIPLSEKRDAYINPLGYLPAYKK
jgi:murein DD-endopeptidase MepM/ murein hydrolase activator NlpD